MNENSTAMSTAVIASVISDHESSESEKELLEIASSSSGSPFLKAPETDTDTEIGKLKSLQCKICRCDWKNIAIMICLWIAYLLCSASYSLIGPFFPKKVNWGTPSRAEFVYN